MRKVVIYDWGGVFQITVTRQPRLAWDERLNLTPGTTEAIVHGIPEWRAAQRGEVSLPEYWREVKDRLKISTEQLTQLKDDFYSGDQLNNDLVTLTQQLHDVGVRIGLMSNNTLDLIETLAEWEVNTLFDAVVISAEIGVMKPDAAAYEAILDKMDVEAAKAIFVDDFVANVEGARAVGMAAIHYKPGMDIEAKLRTYLSGVTS